MCYDGSKIWAMKVEDMQRLQRAKKRIRWMCGVTLKDGKTSEELRERLGVVCLSKRVRQNRLRWFGHVERKDENDWVSACRDLSVAGEKGREEEKGGKPGRSV